MKKKSLQNENGERMKLYLQYQKNALLEEQTSPNKWKPTLLNVCIIHKITQ